MDDIRIHNQKVEIPISKNRMRVIPHRHRDLHQAFLVHPHWQPNEAAVP